MEAKGGACLSPGAFPDSPHALLPTHIGLLQTKSQSTLFGPSLLDITVLAYITRETGFDFGRIEKIWLK